MQFVEYGKAHDPCVMLLHGGGLSWWSCRQAARSLGERYHVILPILDGHAGSDMPFTTIQDCARRLVELIEDGFGGRMLAIGGLSLGGQVLLEMLRIKPDICSFVFLESVLAYPMKRTNRLVGPSVELSYGLISKPWFAKLQFRQLGLPEELFPEYFRDSCLIKKSDMIAFLRENSSFQVDPAMCIRCVKALITVGSRERPVMRRSASLLQKVIPNSRLEVLKGFRHGELSIVHGELYAGMLMRLMEE